MCANVSYGQLGTLGYMLDTSTCDSFLVDTGSVFSVIPHTSTEPASGPKIVAADKTPITCWGWRQRTLQLQGHTFTWSFLLAAVATPIVGANFLEKLRLQVDLTRRRLTHVVWGWAIPLTAPPAGSCFAAIGVGPQHPTPSLPTVEALQQQQQEPPAAAKPPHVPPAVTAGAARILSASSSTSLPTVEPLHHTVEALQQQQEPPGAAKPPYVSPAVTAGAAGILSARCCHINYVDILHSFPEVLNP